MGKANRRNILRQKRNPRTSAGAGAHPDRGAAARFSGQEPSADPVRQLVLDLWRQTRERWQRTDDLVARGFRRFPNLNDGQRDQVVTLFHGMVVHQRKIEAALDRLDLPASEQRHRETLAYTAFLILKGWLKPAAAELPAPGIAWFDPAQVHAAIDAEPDPARRLGLKHGLPDFLAARLLAEYPTQAETIAQALGERAPLTLRVNTLKIARDELLAQLRKAQLAVSPTVLAPQGIGFQRRINPFKLPAFQEGLFDLQDESSQLAAEIVAPPPGSLVIDFCAGAGGKTLALGALMKNKGRLIALDTNARKLTELRKRAARAGLTNLQALAIDESSFPPEVEALRGKAARVLVDVPCTGSGALRRNSEGRWRLTPEDLTRLPILQTAIARRAMELVAPGGRLIYATCSILPEENEQVMATLTNRPELSRVSAEPASAAMTADWQPVLVKEILGKARADAVCDPAGRFLKLLPTSQAHDGFFTAVLRRREK